MFKKPYSLKDHNGVLRRERILHTPMGLFKKGMKVLLPFGETVTLEKPSAFGYWYAKWENGKVSRITVDCCKILE